jgi:AbrB family looped-hinge helix DNA binding protein
MESSIVSAKGQVVISKKIRAIFHINEGTRVHFAVRNGEIILTPLTPEYFENMAGFLGAGGKVLKLLLEERKKERELWWCGA